MDTALVAVVILGALALFIVTRSVVIVPNEFAYVLERFGRFDRVLQPGVHVTMPFIARISARIPLAEQTLEVPAVTCTSQDGASATCGGFIVFRVVDPAAAIAQVTDFRSAVVQLTSSAWANAVGTGAMLESPLAVRDAEGHIRAAAAAWGLEIVRALPLLKLSDEVMRQHETLVSQERDAQVAAWATERRQPLGPDGRPTPEQGKAFAEWLALEVRAHSREIEAAQREYEAANAKREAFETPVVSAPAQFATASAPVQFATARTSIAPGALGTVEAGGREWTARNLSAVEVARGFRCVVERQDGETLLVRAL